MGPVSTKLQGARDANQSNDFLLSIMSSEELPDLKEKYMRLGIEGKEKFMSVLGGDDTYDVLESEDTARAFLKTMSKEQKQELIDKVFGFMNEYPIDLSEPIVDQTPKRLFE